MRHWYNLRPAARWCMALVWAVVIVVAVFPFPWWW
jgi:hypothetical protein